ncbi:MAG: hypothetical protein PHO00_00150 [bacterium]|nr:hypothetical protein [bacterium]
MRSKVILVRSDANENIGFGHMSRCISVAKKLAERKYKPFFILGGSGTEVASILKRLGLGYCYVNGEIEPEKEANEIKSLILRKKAAACLFDSYGLNEAYFKILRDASVPLLLIDDRNYLKFPEIDVIINGNLFAEDLNYKTRKETALYLGTDYFIMDSSFRPPVIGKILKRKVSAGVCLSSVGFEILLKLVKFISFLPFDSVDIILTAFQRRYHKKLSKGLAGDKNINVYFDLNPEEFLSAMGQNMFFVTTGGTMMCQSVCSGCITYAYPVNKYQKRNVLYAEKKKLVKRIMPKRESLAKISKDIAYLSNSKDSRACIVKREIEMIDGKGLNRVTNVILGKINERN